MSIGIAVPRDEIDLASCKAVVMTTRSCQTASFLGSMVISLECLCGELIKNTFSFLNEFQIKMM